VFASGAKRVLERALEIALSHGSNVITQESLFLAVVDAEGGRAAKCLRGAGAAEQMLLRVALRIFHADSSGRFDPAHMDI
jgi:ATP-dependent Clp protease ATP-binding subunit ClpA